MERNDFRQNELNNFPGKRAVIPFAGDAVRQVKCDFRQNELNNSQGKRAVIPLAGDVVRQGKCVFRQNELNNFPGERAAIPFAEDVVRQGKCDFRQNELINLVDWAPGTAFVFQIEGCSTIGGNVAQPCLIGSVRSFSGPFGDAQG